MSWKAIVSGTTFDALTVCVTASRRGSATGTTATLGSIVDRREWIARCLRGHAGKGAEQRRLAGVRYANDLDLHRRALVTRAGQEACSAVGENVVTARPSGNETCPRASKGSALSCRDPAAPGMSASSAQPARPKTSLIESAGRPILQLADPESCRMSRQHSRRTAIYLHSCPISATRFATRARPERDTFSYNLRRFGVREPG